MSERELRERRQSAAWSIAGPPDLGAGRLDATLPQGWPEAGLPVRLPIEHFSPPGSFPVDDTTDTLMSGFPTASSVLYRFTVPANQALRITAIGWDADDDAGMACLRWTGYSDATPIAGMVGQLAALGSVAQPVPVHTTIPGRAVFTIQGTQAVSLYSFTYIVRVIGYLFTPKR